MNLLLSSDQLMFVLVIVGFASMNIGLLLVLISMTVGFRKVVEAEKLVAPPGSEMYRVAHLLGASLVGRTIRTTYMTFFLIVRKLPGWGFRRAAKLGDVEVEVPRHLKRWILIPHLSSLLLAVLFFLCGGLAKWLDTGSLFG